MGEPEETPVRITDKRKIDRDHQVVEPVETTEAEGTGSPEPVPMVEARLLDERTADLQRLQAEYANYRKRAERERQQAGELAVGRVLADFLPVLDNLDLARSHGELTGGLKAIADQLDSVFGKLGLEPVGEVGDTFDPALHEAVMHDVSDDPAITEPTVTTVMRRGYRHGERLLRPAMVGVSDPQSQGG